MTPKEERRIAQRKAVIVAAQVQRLVERKQVSLAPVTMWRKIVAERGPETEEPVRDAELRARLWGINK